MKQELISKYYKVQANLAVINVYKSLHTIAIKYCQDYLNLFQK